MGDRRLLLVLVCFLLSGFAALIYQTAWTREFAFVFGTSELAVATVLAAYMGGLAVGAAAAARLAHRVRRPILAYGLLELGIAVTALAVPFALRAALPLQAALLGTRGDPPEAGGLPTALFYLACSFAILMAPTALMGATLPLLVRYAVRRESEIGSRIGLLYGMNTAGAVAGTLVAGFVLLPALGLRATVWTAVATNALVFLAAAALARGTLPVPPALPRPRATFSAGRWILPAIFVSGVVSFTYEVLWTRLLGHLLGGSVYAFSTMLASFLLGIALGAAWGARLATTRARSIAAFGWMQLGTAVLSLGAFAALDALPGLSAALLSGGASRLARDALLAGAVLLPSTLCIGATFPLAVRVLARDEHDAGPASARTYAWNTAGAIVGAVGAGFFAVPALGFEGALVAGVVANLGLAIACAGFAPSRRPALALGAAAVLGLVALSPPDKPWRLLRATPLGSGAGGAVADDDVTYYAVGRSATVLLLEEPGQWSLRTNGLPEATIFAEGHRAGRLDVAAWLGLLPTLARPETRSLLVVGLGGGLVATAVPPSVREIEIVELEPEVIAANRAVADLRRDDPLADPRVHLRVNDARSALFLTERRFDAIVSQPSHPWTAGASHLYTHEFFALVRDRLTPDGVFVQWIGSTFVDEALLRTLVATLADVFPQVRVYQPEGSFGILFLASRSPLPVEAAAPRAIAQAPDHFAEQALFGAEDVAASLVLDDAGARRLASGAPLSHDHYNLLQTLSPRILGNGLDPASVRQLLAPFDPLVPPPPELDGVRIVRRLLARRDFVRAMRVAKAIPDPVARRTALGWHALERGRHASALRQFAEAAEARPDDPETQAGLLLLQRRAIERGEPLEHPIEDLAPAARAVAQGWRLQEEGEPTGLRALEPELARVAPGEPLFAEAVRLRAAWRTRSGEPARAREAVALLDPVLAFRNETEDLVRRARAAAAAGDTRAALASLTELAGRTGPRRADVVQLAACREILEGLELPPDLLPWGRTLRARLQPPLGATARGPAQASR